jgi:NADH:ubiquinone oxidoreductase subunit 6 (subunit J)
MSTPEQPAAAPPPGAQQPGAPGLAIAGFVCGLVGLVLSAIIICFFIGGPVALVGVVLSAIGLRQANERGAKRGLAIAGLVCGIIGVLIALVVTIIAIASDDSSDTDFDFETSATVILPLMMARGRAALESARARLARHG